MGVHQYFKSLSDLEHIIRCPGKFKYQEHSVASHSFKVTKIAQFLGTVEEESGQKVDWKSLYEKALNHDYAELFTGDIKTPVKYASKELKNLFSEVEEEMTRKFVEKEIPSEFLDSYQKLKRPEMEYLLAFIAMIIFQQLFTLPGAILFMFTEVSFSGDTGFSNIMTTLDSHPWIFLLISGGGTVGAILITYLLWRFMNKGGE